MSLQVHKHNYEYMQAISRTFRAISYVIYFRKILIISDHQKKNCLLPSHHCRWCEAYFVWILSEHKSFVCVFICRVFHFLCSMCISSKQPSKGLVKVIQERMVKFVTHSGLDRRSKTFTLAASASRRPTRNSTHFSISLSSAISSGVSSIR